jgi:hypothetical protein
VATRFYLPSSGAPPVSPAFDSSWTTTTSADRIRCVTSPSSTALTDKTVSVAISHNLFRQYVSDQIGVVSFSGTTLSGVVRCSQTSGSNQQLDILAYLYHSDTTTTSLLAIVTTGSISTIFKTIALSAQTLASVSSSNGDRIVIEIGDDATSSSTVTERFGDNAGSDFALTSGLTTDLNPWMEFSANIPFLFTAPQPTVIAQAIKRASFF